MTVSTPQDRIRKGEASKGRIDPYLLLMAVGFTLTVAAIAFPAFRASALSAPSMMLVLTSGIIAVIGLTIFKRSESRRPLGDTAVDMLDAMAEPAALVWESGQVLAYNAAWAEENGDLVHLPRGKSGRALYMAFAQAREGDQGRAIVQIGDREKEVLIGLADRKSVV